MVKELCNYRGMPVYVDKYAKNNSVILSKSDEYKFLIVSPDISEHIKLISVRENRNRFIDDLLS